LIKDHIFINSLFILIRQAKPIDKIKLVGSTDFNANPEDPQQRRERKFELSRKHVPKIYDGLKKGKTVLEIFRTRQGKQTEYHVKAVR
jgi:hypothetical protein